MNKDQMAHEMAVAMQSQEPMTDMKLLAALAYQYADAMQVEADKRASQKRAELRELLNQPGTFVEKEGQHFDDVEFEVDWDQAPGWANAWTYRESTNEGVWWLNPPTIKVENWFVCHLGNECISAPTFGYTGYWYNSLRKRPEIEVERHG